jgi:hypothetical protein
VNNEQIIRTAYERAEKVDVKGWVECFTSDGTFTDMSIGVTYRGPVGPTGLGKTVEVYAKAFPDMHRDLYRVFSVGDVVVVELALQGTHGRDPNTNLARCGPGVGHLADDQYFPRRSLLLIPSCPHLNTLVS